MATTSVAKKAPAKKVAAQKTVVKKAAVKKPATALTTTKRATATAPAVAKRAAPPPKPEAPLTAKKAVKTKPPGAAQASPEFQRLYDELRLLILSHGKKLVVVMDKPGKLYLNHPRRPQDVKDHFFGGVMLHKTYVSYYLAPVYQWPGLLAASTDGLKRRMQGKSCFNFTSMDTVLMRELTALTAKAAERCRQAGLET